MASQPRVRVWAVLGDPRAGKSTVIGHLISQFGKGPGGIREVLLRGGGYLYVYGKRMAWQEAKKTPKQVVTIIRGQAQRLQLARPPISAVHLNVLMALRFDAVGKYDFGREYLSHFVQQGWSIESLVLLSPSDKQTYEYSRFGAPTLSVADAQELEVSWMVGQVRNHFGWA